ncbi:hypothetical protein BDN70DRAFT_883841 [Pholiota conissans]|uniref:Uncharacterized protein n=1 Tax=Pholiota conissans TaxID=109636 RepID=A0A9P5YWQ6_9AGAR|nr:hypothetical protein BDN70DRAFT_883841 [Pholiota conissans]
MSQSDPYLTALSLLGRLHFLLLLSSDSLYIRIYFAHIKLYCHPYTVFTVELFTLSNGLLTSNTYTHKITKLVRVKQHT